MKIMRFVNGMEMEFELTFGELWEAYKEEQHKCDLSDIDDAFEGLSDADLMEMYGVTREKIEELREAMAYRYREYRDNCDESWIGDRDEAIRYVLMENNN